MYTKDEKIKIVKLKNQNLSLTQIQAEFGRVFIGRPIPNISTISRIISRFMEEDCIKSEHNI